MSIVATDALMPKHQGISIHSAGSVFIVIYSFKNNSVTQITLESKMTF